MLTHRSGALDRLAASRRVRRDARSLARSFVALPIAIVAAIAVPACGRHVPAAKPSTTFRDRVLVSHSIFSDDAKHLSAERLREIVDVSRRTTSGDRRYLRFAFVTAIDPPTMRFIIFAAVPEPAGVAKQGGHSDNRVLYASSCNLEVDPKTSLLFAATSC